MSAKIDNKIVLNAALVVAERDGFINMTREKIASQAGVSVGKVTMAFGSMKKLRRKVMRQAIKQNKHSIMLDGLLLKMPCCLKIKDDILKKNSPEL